MDSLKYVLGVIAMVLCMGIVCAVIWILLFGIPKGAMDGGTLVQEMRPLRQETGALVQEIKPFFQLGALLKGSLL